MKINATQLQVYNNTIQQRQQPHLPADSPKAEPNHFANSKFSQLLSTQEKNFIVQNFKPDTTLPNVTAHLGRIIDVRA